MSRIHALTIQSAPAPTQPPLEAVGKKLGMVPNLFLTVAHSPAAFKSYMAQSEALGSGTLAPALREQLALTVAGANGCDYCASAHTLIGKGAGLTADDAANSLRGRASNATAQAALDFATAVIGTRGHVGDAQLTAVRAAGFTEGEIVEIVAHVALNVFTNYLNNVAQTVIDFPKVSAAGTPGAAQKTA